MSGVKTSKAAALSVVTAGVAVAILLPAAARSLAARPPVTADSSRARVAAVPRSVRAPSQPPLSTGGAPTAEAVAEGPAVSAPPAESDPLVSNGLGSPSCRGAIGTGALSTAGARNCATSGFSAAAAPTGNYGLDVHIDTGFLGLSTGGLLSIVQDLFVAPLWMALVWSVHALVVMLEWCFAIDLLDSPASGGVGRGLRQMQASFTDPWLATVLAVAAVLAVYNGVIRRRVADTLGQAVAMVAMMAGGMWLIADPGGTVGAVGAWANQASLGTLAVSARGADSRAARALPDSMAALFSSAVEAPWCYLEFGDVGWCRTPARLDPRLHRAALRIASADLALIGCRSGGLAANCVPAGGSEAQALGREARLLREAGTNGATFLALTANGPARNSINDPSSLLRAICGTAQATHCTGPAAAAAEFRTNSGTWPRVGGLVMILAGLLGMLLLFGFIGLRLLGAAIFSLLYLLLAPAAILAPAFGEAGRSLFRRWAAQLLAAVVSKLLFSFLLGAILGVLSILASLEALGWWTQWLLMSAFWWGAYARRHDALAVVQGASHPQRGGGRVSSWQATRRHASLTSIVRKRTVRGVEAQRDTRRLAAGARGRLSAARAELSATGAGGRASGVGSALAADEQATRLLASERRDAQRRIEPGGELETRLAAKRSRLAKLQAAQRHAALAGDGRRAAELGTRSKRVEAEVVREQRGHEQARGLLERSNAGSGRAGAGDQARERSAFLDAQAKLPASLERARPRDARRDYPRLAPLVGIGRDGYARLAPGAQRAARLEIDRELTRRRQLRGSVAAPLRAGSGAPASADAAASVRPRARGAAAAAARPGAGGGVAGAAPPRARRAVPGAEPSSESAVMRDAREVAARRKRQLGFNRP